AAGHRRCAWRCGTGTALPAAGACTCLDGRTGHGAGTAQAALVARPIVEPPSTHGVVLLLPPRMAWIYCTFHAWRGSTAPSTHGVDLLPPHAWRGSTVVPAAGRQTQAFRWLPASGRHYPHQRCDGPQ